MERRRKERTETKPQDPELYTLVRGEEGFTYVELAVVLSLLALMIPVFLAVGLELEKGVKKITAEEELRSEAGAFTADVREDIQRGRNFRLSPEGWLLFDLPSGETVRYKQHRRRVIRSVRPPGHTAFRGTTVLVHHVYFISFEPRRDGVGIELGMQNWHGDYDRKFFVGGRLTE